MKLIVTIEKQKDGTYIAYNTNDDNVTIIGTGDSVSAAKDDFFNSINETIEACEETGLSIPQSLKEEPEFRFDVASLFEYYKLINVSAFAEYIGINASLLRQYKLGSTYISDAQLQKIEDGIHSIGLEFTRLKLVWFTIDEWKECDIALLFLSVAGGKIGVVGESNGLMPSSQKLPYIPLLRTTVEPDLNESYKKAGPGLSLLYTTSDTKNRPSIEVIGPCIHLQRLTTGTIVSQMISQIFINNSKIYVRTGSEKDGGIFWNEWRTL